MKRFLNPLRSYSTGGENVAIPARIKRGPTDLLKALAGTIQYEDTTGGHYKYHDDPYLIPASAVTSRTYAFAKEAGRKAARQIAAEWPTLLYYDEDFPRLSAFRPQKKPQEETGDTEEVLLDRMKRHWPLNAVSVYRNMRSQDKEVSRDTQMDLLEFLAWTNCEDDVTLDESEWDEERWFKNFIQNQKKAGNASSTFRNKWKEGGDADILFEEIEPKTGRQYSAKICGMAKHMDGEKAYDQLTRARADGIRLSVEAYNAIIPVCHFLGTTNAEERWEKVKEVLSWMKDDGVRPNLGTFNAALHVLGRGRMWKGSEREAVKVFQEMARLGIEPSAGSYKGLLAVFDRAPVGLVRGILRKSFDRLEGLGEDLEIRDEVDEQFFVGAILLIKNKLDDVELATRLQRILKKGNNSLLLTNSAAAQLYYTCFVRLMADKLPTGEFLEIYRKVFPFHFSPDNETSVTIFQNVERNGEWSVLPELYSDFVSGGMVWRETPVEEFLRVLGEASLLASDEKLKSELAAVALDINNRYDIQYGIPNFVPYLTWKPDWVVHVALIVARTTGDVRESSRIFKKLVPGFQADKPEEERILVRSGSPRNDLMVEYFEFCLTNGSFQEMYDVLLVADKYELNCTRELGVRCKNSGTLTEHQRRVVLDIISGSPGLGPNINTQENYSESVELSVNRHEF